MKLDDNQNKLLGMVITRSKAQGLFSIDELAEFLEVSVRSIRRMHVRGGAPPRLRRGKRLMYPSDEVLAWLPKYLLAHTDHQLSN